MIKPLDKYVLVKPKEMKTSGGIYLPQMNTDYFVVIGVGKNVIELKIGNTVIINQAASKQIKYQNENYYLIKEENILAVVEE